MHADHYAIMIAVAVVWPNKFGNDVVAIVEPKNTQNTTRPASRRRRRCRKNPLFINWTIVCAANCCVVSYSSVR